MFLYFDSQGVLREIVQDNSVRQGDVNSKRIYVYLEGDPIIDDLWCIVKKPDGTVTNEISIKDNVAYMEIPYNKNRDLKYFEDYYEYHFYYYELPPMVESGLATATFRAVIDNSIVAQGIVTFNVESNVINIDHEITQSQYDYLIQYVSEQIGGIKNAYLKSVDYNRQLYTFEFIDQSDTKRTFELPFKDVYAKLEELNRDITNNRVGLLRVSDYDEDTGVITLYYDENIVRMLNYNADTGILTITYDGGSY